MTLTPKSLLARLGIQYRERGNRLQLCCLWHDDRNPSAAFYQDTGLFHCFTCRLTLDVISFYARCVGVPEGRAIDDLKKDYEFEVNVESSEEKDKQTAFMTGVAQRTLSAIEDFSERGAAYEELEGILHMYKKTRMTASQAGQALLTWVGRWSIAPGSEMLREFLD